MILAMTLAASLAQSWMRPPVENPAGPDISGRYAELQASGVSGCNTAGVPRTLDIHILAEPPHYRSANIGEMAYDLGEGDAPCACVHACTRIGLRPRLSPPACACG